MRCPCCQNDDLKVVDSRDFFEVNAIKRRRECQKCAMRFTTFETIELNVQVQKRDGKYEDFQQQKLINGLDAACRHTGISREQVTSLAAEITSDIKLRKQREISTKELGNIVMQRLLVLDAIAYIRFACVYRRFKDIDELMEAIKSIQPKDH